MSGFKLRLLGLAMICGGALFGYSAADGLANALDRTEQIYQSVKLFLLTPLLLVFGVLFLWGGERLETEARAQRSIVLSALACALALGGLAWWFLGARLAGV